MSCSRIRAPFAFGLFQNLPQLLELFFDKYPLPIPETGAIRSRSCCLMIAMSKSFRAIF